MTRLLAVLVMAAAPAAAPAADPPKKVDVGLPAPAFKIKDPSGILTPERAATLIPAVQAALGGKPLELHSHASLGLSPRTSQAPTRHGCSSLARGRCAPTSP